ncbi:hypothetical protein [Nocardioides nitrophenolicus]|uniref:hypothetical protein n=1 Tax=Nocardioides nitrophenolicus TaxID=60489 RepID=UPI00195A62D8|nr:hypothetical protein [Nocardioides nitrophenolicus]MBM7518254.1 hypothetical protein [Nocardioides nitrophenolicus]
MTAGEIEYVIVETGAPGRKELGVISARSVAEAAAEAEQWVSGLDDWSAWELLKRSTREQVAYSSVEDGFVLVDLSGS